MSQVSPALTPPQSALPYQQSAIPGASSRLAPEMSPSAKQALLEFIALLQAWDREPLEPDGGEL